MGEKMIKKIISWIINLALIVLVFTLSSLQIVSSTILSKQYVMKTLEKSNYYEKTYNDIQEGFKNYIMQSGLEENILEGLCDKETVIKDINMLIEKIYEGKSINLDTKKIENKLDNEINRVLKKNNKKIDNDEKEAIQTFKNAIINVYNTSIVYSNSYIEQISLIYQKMNKVIKMAQIILIIAITIITIISVITLRKQSIKNIGISLLATGILQIILKILVGNKLYNILILNSTFTETLINLIKNIMDTFFLVGIITSTVGIITIIIRKYYGKRR